MKTYLVQAHDSIGAKFIYETNVLSEDYNEGDLVYEIASGGYSVGALNRIFFLDDEAMTVVDVTVEIAEAVREWVVARGEAPLDVVRQWINKVGIDPIEIRDGH